MSSAAKVETNPRGIPKAIFVDQVERYVAEGDGVENRLRQFSEMVSKYKFMEANLLQRKKNLLNKRPELEKSLAMVQFLAARKDAETSMETHYELNDTLYAQAKISSTKTVNLWLGANVMLEYTLEEAEELLSNKLSAATKSLEQIAEDLDFLRDQITTVEVNTARVHNWDVKMRRERQQKEE
ncbi:MAG: Prefoldin subunit-domain-containing protein [Piptocephalis tieghemiana]|nr:MAG: Prefoldin subunit-domain-containing protein [Piptocephalis tieghemiana]